MYLMMSLVWFGFLTFEPAQPAAGPAVQAQHAGPRDAAQAERAEPSDEETVTRVILLQHVLAERVVGTLQQLGYHTMAAAPGVNALVVRGSQQSVAAMQELIRSMDVPSEKKQPPAESVKKVIPLSHASVRELVEVIAMVSAKGLLQYGVDERTNSLVLSGKAQDVEWAAQLVQELDRPASAMGDRDSERHGALKLEFIFLRGSLKPADGGGSGAQLPKSLHGVAEALADNGFYDVQMMAPIHLVADPAAKFEQETGIRVTGEQAERLMIRVRGQADYGSEGMVLASIDAEVSGNPLTVSPGSALTNTLFDLQTTLSIPLDEYLVLAAAPSSNPWSDCLVLVMRASDK